MSDTPFAITLSVGSSLANKTGSWRTERPVYVNGLPPCNDACPAGENIQGWLYEAESGSYERAWQVLVRDNPFPAVMGRVCYHPCQTACNRAQLDQPVGINSVERYLGDAALAGGWSLPEGAPDTGRRVVVYGGGNTAMDAARTARRLGADEAIVVYRRTRDRMPAHDIEVQEALEEGVLMRWLSTIKHIDAGTMTVERMELDESGFPQPTGETEELAADSVVLALGQDVDLSLLDGVPDLTVRDGVVQVDENLMTGHAGIFAGGDMVPSERTVTVAVGHGKHAARTIDAWLRDHPFEHAPRPELATFDSLNTWYYTDAPKTVRPTLELARRVSTFDEVKQGLDHDTALFEARRCLSCGNCFGCDNCFGVCPDNAVRKLPRGSGDGDNGRDYAFDLDYCKGCGICVSECPSGAIVMVPEST